jgi:UDP-N-acetylmuramyl pentapeptide phosphotransferase/UDP-N-acetylglucosamine-1-phosphate transferase
MRVNQGGADAGVSAGRDRQPVDDPKTATAVAARIRPPMHSARIRPRWHKVLGGLVVLSALAVVFINELELTVLPGSHNELYLVLSAAIAGFGMWWLGWFDDQRSSNPTDREAVRQRP